MSRNYVDRFYKFPVFQSIHLNFLSRCRQSCFTSFFFTFDMLLLFFFFICCIFSNSGRYELFGYFSLKALIGLLFFRKSFFLFCTYRLPNLHIFFFFFFFFKALTTIKSIFLRIFHIRKIFENSLKAPDAAWYCQFCSKDIHFP